MIASETDPALLETLFQRARNYKMTPAEVREQRVSFVYGQMSRSGVSKDWVREKLRESLG